jgi:hypothetical protein
VKPLFSQDPQALLIYKHDLKTLKEINPLQAKALNQNLEQLNVAVQALTHHPLLVMPAVDKYALYRPYLTASFRQQLQRYPVSPLMNWLSAMPKHYTLINTQAILSPLLQQGVQDVFYPDDTHWSWQQGSRVVVKALPIAPLKKP